VVRPVTPEVLVALVAAGLTPRAVVRASAPDARALVDGRALVAAAPAQAPAAPAEVLPAVPVVPAAVPVVLAMVQAGPAVVQADPVAVRAAPVAGLAGPVVPVVLAGPEVLGGPGLVVLGVLVVPRRGVDLAVGSRRVVTPVATEGRPVVVMGRGRVGRGAVRAVSGLGIAMRTGTTTGGGMRGRGVVTRLSGIRSVGS
jgi:hypothetical protein